MSGKDKVNACIFEYTKLNLLEQNIEQQKRSDTG